MGEEYEFGRPFISFDEGETFHEVDMVPQEMNADDLPDNPYSGFVDAVPHSFGGEIDIELTDEGKEWVDSLLEGFEAAARIVADSMKEMVRAWASCGKAVRRLLRNQDPWVKRQRAKAVARSKAQKPKRYRHGRQVRTR